MINGKVLNFVFAGLATVGLASLGCNRPVAEKHQEEAPLSVEQKLLLYEAETAKKKQEREDSVLKFWKETDDVPSLPIDPAVTDGQKIAQELHFVDYRSFKSFSNPIYLGGYLRDPLSKLLVSTRDVPGGRDGLPGREIVLKTSDDFKAVYHRSFEITMQAMTYHPSEYKNTVYAFDSMKREILETEYRFDSANSQLVPSAWKRSIYIVDLHGETHGFGTILDKKVSSGEFNAANVLTK